MQALQLYIADLKRDIGRKWPWILALVALGAILEGVGVLAILPFAALISGEANSEWGQVALEAIDWVGASSQLGRALFLAGFFLLLLALRALVIWWRDLALHELGLGYVDRLRSRLFRAIGKADWATVQRLRRNEIEHAITNDVVRLSTGTNKVLRGGVAVAISLVQLTVIALLAPLLLLLVMALLLVAMMVTLPLTRKASKMGHKLTKSGRLTHGVLGDFLENQKLARLHNSEDNFRDHFENAITDVRVHQMSFYRSQTAARIGFQYIAGIVVIASLLVGVFILETPLAILALTLVVLARLVGPVQTIIQTAQSISNTLPAFMEIQQVLNQLDQHARPHRSASIARKETRLPAAIRLEDVTFSHEGQSIPTVNGLDLTVEAGAIVALNGPSGVGKTTVLDLITGLLKPSSGTVSVDGLPLNDEISFAEWRDQVSYLPQDPFLFDTSIRENLVWRAGVATDEEIWAALSLAHADKFVRKLPNGLDTRAGDRGTQFSGGERQRLCIASAILRKSRFLILDEATNALDGELEERVLKNLMQKNGQYSILLVTHRAETLRHADHVITL